MSLADIQHLVVTVAAGISAVGIPVLIALIWRLHEKQVETLKLFTFKEVEAQIEALENTYVRINKRLREYVAEIERQKFEIPQAESEKRLAILRGAIEKLEHMSFVGGDPRDSSRDMLRQMFALANVEAMEQARSVLAELSSYEEQLKRQIGPAIGVTNRSPQS